MADATRGKGKPAPLLALACAALVALTACSEEDPPGQAAAAIGVPPGDALFSSARDARNFNRFADTFTTLDCTGLAASRAALRTQAEKTTRTSTGTVAAALGTLIGGPAGALASVIGQEATALVSKSGNLRLAAVEAVAVAKNCDGRNPGAPDLIPEPPGPPPTPDPTESTFRTTEI